MNIYVVLSNGDVDSAFCVENDALARKAEIDSDVTVNLIVTKLYGFSLTERTDHQYLRIDGRNGRFGVY